MEMRKAQADDSYDEEFEEINELDENPDNYTNFRRSGGLIEKRPKKEKRKSKKKTGSPPSLINIQYSNGNEKSEENKNNIEDVNVDVFNKTKPDDHKRRTGLPVVEGFDPRNNTKMVPEEEASQEKRMVCPECSMIGYFSAVDDRVKKVIKNEYDKTRSTKCQGRCVVCFKEGHDLQVVTADVEAAMKSIAYSHTFYDKFSRESKAPNVDSVKLQLPPIDEGKTLNDTSKRAKKKPVLPIKNDFPGKDQEFPREQQKETTKSSTLTYLSTKPKKPINIMNPLGDPFFENFYVTRGMKGSVLRKDRRIRPLGKVASEEWNFTPTYSVGSLGLVYQIPDNNHSILPDSVFKTSSFNGRPYQASNYRPFSLLPPVKPKRRPLSYSQFSI